MTRARETSENARLAKAWVNFDGTFGTSPFTEANGGIRSAFNVSSITDVTGGVYVVNFENAMEDADYTISAFGSIATQLCVLWNGSSNSDYNPTTTSFRIATMYVSNTSGAGQPTDASRIYIIIYR